MDLGAVVCLPRAPRCHICPVKNFCRATDPALLPIKRPPSRIKNLTEQHAFVLRSEKILLQHAHHRWRGMWMMPSLRTAPKKKRPVHLSVFPFTHYRVTLRIFAGRPRKIDSLEQRWFSIRALDSIPIPSPHRRALRSLISIG
jgi:A/G-specific adenine glycosylase